MCTEPFVSTKYVILRSIATFCNWIHTTDIIQNQLHNTKKCICSYSTVDIFNVCYLMEDWEKQ